MEEHKRDSTLSKPDEITDVQGDMKGKGKGKGPIIDVDSGTYENQDISNAIILYDSFDSKDKDIRETHDEFKECYTIIKSLYTEKEEIEKIRNKSKLLELKSINKTKTEEALIKLVEIYKIKQEESLSKEATRDIKFIEKDIEKENEDLIHQYKKGSKINSKELIKSLSSCPYKKRKEKEMSKLNRDYGRLIQISKEINTIKETLVDNDRTILDLLIQMKICRQNRIKFEKELECKEKTYEMSSRELKYQKIEVTLQEFDKIKDALIKKGITKGVLYKGFDIRDNNPINDKIIRFAKRNIIGTEWYNPIKSNICVDNMAGTLYFFKINRKNIWEFDFELNLRGSNIGKEMSERTKCISSNGRFNHDLTEYKVFHLFVDGKRKQSLIEES